MNGLEDGRNECPITEKPYPPPLTTAAALIYHIREWNLALGKIPPPGPATGGGRACVDELSDDAKRLHHSAGNDAG